MKKILIICSLILFVCATIVNAKAYFAPDWSEFCPTPYVNLDTNKTYKLAIKKYWQRRKIEFEKKVAQCQQYEEIQKESCYEEIRRIEGNMTQTYMRDKEIRTLEQLNTTYRYRNN